MFPRLGQLVYRRRVLIVVAFAVLFPLAGFVSRDVRSALKSGGFEDPTAESWQVKDALEAELGVGQADLVLIYRTKEGTVDDPEVLGGVLAAVARVEQDEDVIRTVNYYQTGAKQLVSRDQRSTLVVVSLRGDEQRKADAVRRLQPAYDAPGLEVMIGGITPFNEALNQVLERDLWRAEAIAFPITALLLVLIFGSAVSASMPLILGAMAVVFAFAALRVLLAFTDASIFAANVVSVLGLGLAIDYSLFMLNRFREELPHHGVEGAVVRAVSTTGRAVAFSGITVAASLCGLFVFPQMFLRSMGLGGIVVVLGAVVLALTLLPAMLGILGHRIDALRVPLVKPAVRGRQEGGFWRAVSASVMRRPIAVAVLVVVPLVLLGAPFLRFDPSIPDYRILPEDDPVRIASEILDGEFLAHQSTPHEILVRVQGEALSRENLEKIRAVGERVAALPGVAKVDSLFTILPGGPEDDVALLSKPAAEQDPQIRALIDEFAKGPLMRMHAVSAHPFNHETSLAHVRAIRAMSTPEVRVEVGGGAGILLDLKTAIAERAPWMVFAVAVAMFVVLFLVFGSVTLPIKAMIMNSLSLTASFGAMVWIFQDGRFQEELHYKAVGISEATSPLLMFAIVFGLSMDYEVLLLSRVREEYLRTGDNAASVAVGLERTGRLITSAAALLVVVIGAFATSQVVFMKTLGVGMALAIALDATVVRALLVPAAMHLMGRWNWWAPAPLLRLWERIGMSDLEGADPPPRENPPSRR